MTPERWQQVNALLDAVFDLPADQQAAFLDEACADDPALREEVESVLEAEANAPAFLDNQAVEYVDVLYTDTAPPPDIEGNLQIGPYRVIRELGRGGMSVVYLAEHTEGTFAHPVALKLLQQHFQTQDRIVRFRAERQILGRLDHPNIARLLDGGITQTGQPFLVVEHVEGRPITDYCAQNNLSVDDRERLLQTVCRVVQHAHGRLVVHRDLKPSNILVTDAGTVKLLDFGIAKLLDENAAGVTLPVTRTGERLMTPEYAAPEQIRSEPITTATDVYQLGVLAYEMLTDRHPFCEAKQPLSDIERHVLESTPTRPSAVTGGGTGRGVEVEKLSGDLDTIVLKALRKEPTRRYASPGDLADDLERHLQGRPVTARPATWRYRAQKFVRRNRATVLTSLLLGLILVTYVATLTVQANRIAEERNRARQESARSERVTQFLITLFESLDPNETQGEALSAQALLDRGADRLARQMDEDPLVQTRLLNAIGNVYRKQGQYEKAIRLFRQAIDVHNSTDTPAPSGLATSLTDLGTTLTITGAYAAADSSLRRALSLRRAQSPSAPLGVAASLNALAFLNREMQNYDRAATLYHEALDLRKQHLPPNDPNIAETLNNLGLILAQKEDYAAAITYYREALSIRKAQYGSRHTAVAHSLSHLGWVHEMQSDYATADSLYHEALAVRRAVLGEEHLATANSLNMIGWVKQKRGQYAEAERYLRQALDRYRTLLGPEHIYVANAQYKLSVLLVERKQYAAARSLYTEAFQLRRALRGLDDAYTLTLMTELSEVLVRHNRFADAETLLHESLRLQLVNEVAPQDLAYTRRVLGYGLLKQGKYNEAEPFLQAAHAARAHAPNEAQLATRHLVELYEATGHPQQALQYRQVLNAAPPPATNE